MSIIYCIPKVGDTIDHAKPLSTEISCVQAASNISEGISFQCGRCLDMADVSPPCFCTRRAKKCHKNFTPAGIQVTGHRSILISFIFRMYINMLEVWTPYLFGTTMINI